MVASFVDTRKAKTPWASYAPLVALAIVIAAFGMYIFNLTGWQENDDEGSYLYQAWRISEGEVPYRDFLTPQLPVFLYSGGLLMKITGPSLFPMRALSVCLVLLTSFLIFLIGQRLFGPQAGLLSQFVFLTHPDVFRQGRFFRPEAPLLFWSALGLALFIWAVEHERRWMLALSGVAFALGTLSKLFGLLPLAGCLLFWGWQGLRREIDWRQLVSRALFLLGPYLLSVGVVVGGFALAVPGFFDAVLGHHLRQGQELSRLEIVFEGLRLYQEWFQRDPLFILVALCGVAAVLRHPRRGVLAWQLPTVLAFLLLSRKLGMRHLMYLLPALSLLSVAALSFLLHRGRCWTLLGLVLVSMVVVPWILRDIKTAPLREEATAKVAAYIQSRTAPQDFILLDYPGLSFYSQRRTTYSGAAISHGATSTGQITGHQLVKEMVDTGVKLVVIDSGLLTAHQMCYMGDFGSFFRFVRTYYSFERSFQRVSRGVNQRLLIFYTDIPPDEPVVPLDITYRQEANLGDAVTFLGFNLDRATVRPGETLRLILFWQAQRWIQDSWSVFTHLLDDQDRVWGQKDKVPLDSLFPTMRWAPGEIVDDEYEIVVSPETPLGECRLEVGMYKWTTGERLPVFDMAGRRVPGDQVLLETVIQVTAP